MAQQLVVFQATPVDCRLGYAVFSATSVFKERESKVNPISVTGWMVY